MYSIHFHILRKFHLMVTLQLMELSSYKFNQIFGFRDVDKRKLTPALCKSLQSKFFILQQTNIHWVLFIKDNESFNLKIRTKCIYFLIIKMLCEDSPNRPQKLGSISFSPPFFACDDIILLKFHDHFISFIDEYDHLMGVAGLGFREAKFSGYSRIEGERKLQLGRDLEQIGDSARKGKSFTGFCADSFMKNVQKIFGKSQTRRGIGFDFGGFFDDHRSGR